MTFQITWQFCQWSDGLGDVYDWVSEHQKPHGSTSHTAWHPSSGHTSAILLTILPLRWTSNVVQSLLKWNMFFINFNRLQLRLPVYVSLTFKHSYTSSDTVCLKAPGTHVLQRKLLSSEPHCQGLHILSTGHRLAEWVSPSKLPALALGPYATLTLVSAAMWLCWSGLKLHMDKFSGGPSTALHPLLSCHTHIETHMCMQSHVHFLALFQLAENKNWEPLV